MKKLLSLFLLIGSVKAQTKIDTVILMPGKGTIMYVSATEDTVYSRIDTASSKAYHQLKWSDFKGKPCGEHAASSSTNILWSYDQDQDGTISHISAETNFDPDKSWTITNNLYILKHEQGHLDIARIICEKVFKDLNPHKKYTEKEWLRLKSFYEEEWFHLDDNYDAKTDHSNNRQVQASWNMWIAAKLKK